MRKYGNECEESGDYEFIGVDRHDKSFVLLNLKYTDYFDEKFAWTNEITFNLESLKVDWWCIGKHRDSLSKDGQIADTESGLDLEWLSQFEGIEITTTKEGEG